MVRVLRSLGSFAGEGHRSTLRLEEVGTLESSRPGGIGDCTWRRKNTPREEAQGWQIRRTFPCGMLAAIRVAVRSDPGHKTSIDQCCFPGPSLIAVIGAHNVARPGHIFNPDKNITAVEEGEAEIKVV